MCCSFPFHFGFAGTQPSLSSLRLRNLGTLAFPEPLPPLAGAADEASLVGRKKNPNTNQLEAPCAAFLFFFPRTLSIRAKLLRSP